MLPAIEPSLVRCLNFLVYYRYAPSPFRMSLLCPYSSQSVLSEQLLCSCPLLSLRGLAGLHSEMDTPFSLMIRWCRSSAHGTSYAARSAPKMFSKMSKQMNCAIFVVAWVLHYISLFCSDFITRQIHITAPLLHADFLNLPSSLDQNTELPQKISSSGCHGFLFSLPKSSLPLGRRDDGVRRTFICRQVCQRILIGESRGPRALLLVEKLEGGVRRANCCRLFLPDQVHLAPSHMMGYLLCWAL